MSMATRIIRQKRRIATLACGGLLAVYAAHGPAFGVLAFAGLFGFGVAVVVFIPAYRSWLETVGLGLAAAVLVAMILPLSAATTVPILGVLGIIGARYALYGNWSSRFDLWLPLKLTQMRPVHQPPKAVWAAAAPGGGAPHEVFPGSVEEVFTDEDDPETIYVAHFDGREDTVTFLTRRAPSEARFLRSREGDTREALVELRISEFALGHSYVTMTASYDHLKLPEMFELFFDDALGDEMDSLAAWLEGTEDKSLFALNYGTANEAETELHAEPLPAE